MLLPNSKLRHLNCVAHDGKLVVVGTDNDGALWYSVKRDGFEDTSLSAPKGQEVGWEPWHELPLPELAEDASVREREADELTAPKGTTTYLLRSRYKQRARAAAAPAQLVSALDHLYVFRQSTTGTLLVDRFVLDGLTNRLKAKLEVRYKRSRQRHRPSADMQRSAGGLQNVDTLDFRDTDDVDFTEPTTELCLVDGLADGWFSVVFVPTGDHDKHYWHVFAHHAASARIVVTSIRASEEGLFDVKDGTVFDPQRGTAQLVPRRISGVQRRTLAVSGATITGGPAATAYDVQREKLIPDTGEKQLQKAETRIMLAFATSLGTATLSYAVAADGTLSTIGPDPAQIELLRSEQKDVLLPLDTLDAIRPLGDTSPLPQGVIAGLRVGTAKENAEDQVVVLADGVTGFKSGDRAELKGTRTVDGVFKVEGVADDTFTVASPAELGRWQKLETEAKGLYFEGMISAWDRTADGKLRVTAKGHGLQHGDSVQIVGTATHDGTFPVTRIDDKTFVVERRWTQGEAINVRLRAQRRRGLVLDGTGHVDLPPESLPAGDNFTIAFWARGAAGMPARSALLEAVDAANQRLLWIGTWDGNVFCDVYVAGLFDRAAVRPAAAALRGTWAHWAFVKRGNRLEIFLDGASVGVNTTAARALGKAAQLRLARELDRDYPYSGTLADLAIWGRALDARELQSIMHAPPTGRELDLRAIWRLGTVVDETPPKVLDQSPHERHGTVVGGAFAGSAPLPRTLQSGEKAAAYRNEHLVAVTQHATYIEELEFRVTPADGAAAPTAAWLNDVGGGPIFKIGCWGRKSSTSEVNVPIPVVMEQFAAPSTDGWFSARGRFTIPDGVHVIRSFELAEVRGEWKQLEVRRHRLRLASDSITRETFNDTVTLSTVVDDHAALATRLDTVRDREQTEVGLVQEQRVLEERLALVSDPQVAQRRIDELTRRIAGLDVTIQARQAELDALKADPRNGVFHVVPYLVTDKRLEASLAGGVVVAAPSDSPNQQWEFHEQGTSDSWYLTNAGALSAAIGATTRGQHVFTADLFSVNPYWYIRQVDGRPADHYDFLLSRLEPHRLALISGAVVKLPPLTNIDFATWILRPIPDRENLPCRTARAALDRARDDRAAAQRELDGLRAALQNRTAALDALNQLLARLAAVRGELREAVAQFLTGLQSAQRAFAMPDLSPAATLKTRGVLLAFVQPAGRLHAFENCEGNVQLTYLDRAGCVRQTLFDATHDSANAIAEQWIPDAYRACLDFDGPGRVVELAEGVALAKEWTVEAWFQHPLPAHEWSALLGSADGQDVPIAVHRGQFLGARSQGMFYGSGHALAAVAPGWHHVAVRRNRDDELAFFLDGAPVGRTVPLATLALALDGLDDALELDPASVPQGDELSLCFWARADAGALADAPVLEATDGAGNVVLAVSLPAADGQLRFVCAQDTLARPVVAADVQGPWIHWAFTRSATTGTLRVYRNGRPWHEQLGRVGRLAAAEAAYIGRRVAGGAHLRGQLADLCVFDRELTRESVLEVMGGKLEPGDVRLTGLWRFPAREGKLVAQDVSAKRRGGKLLGDPAAAAPGFSPTSTIARIGSVGALDTAPLPAIRLAGTEYVELPTASVPAGNEITIALWLKGADRTPGRWITLSALDAANNRVVLLSLPWSDGAINFDCGNAGALYDRLGAAAPASDYRDVWTFWAFTKNAATGEMMIYRNGSLWRARTGATRPLTAVASVQLGAMNGASGWPGEIAGLDIWSRALGPDEIREAMHTTRTGREAGLVGSWSFTATQARDASPAARHGTYRNNPTFLATGGPRLRSEHAGRLAEVRIWSVALGDAEIESDSVSLLTGREPGLLAYYPLREGTGAVVRDATGSGAQGTVRGAPWTACAAPIGRIERPLQALQFDGVDDLVTGDVRLLDGLSDFTLEGWVKGAAFPAGRASLFGQNDLVELGLVGGRPSAWILGGPEISAAQALPPNEWRHVALVRQATSFSLYVDGVRVADGALPAGPPGGSGHPFTLGAGVWAGGTSDPFQGRLAEVRVWARARTAAELLADRGRRLSGSEPGLLRYWPLDELRADQSPPRATDRSAAARHAPVSGAAVLADPALPMRPIAAVPAEYSTVGVDPATGARTAMMRRCLVVAGADGPRLYTDKRVEALTMTWVGNTQFAPTLLGYIEGAPPIPSENLTVDLSYNGATSVELVTSEDVEFRWDGTRDDGVGATLETFAGLHTEVSSSFGIGVQVEKKIGEVRFGVRGDYTYGKQRQTATAIVARTSRKLADKLELRGTPEQTAKFDHLGKRFIPKNVGYALVISGTADLYVLKLARSGRMVSYETRPIDGLPPDVNTVTFLINPTYTMQGSLDGQTGTRPTSDRYFRDVPQLRAQYGGLYPASYYRLAEAYALKREIDAADKRRESFYEQFDSTVVGDAALRQAEEAPQAGAPADDGAQDGAAAAADGGDASEIARRQAAIEARLGDQQQRANARAQLDRWQRRMEAIRERAGKRNIANTYVWDADGGLRSESHGFASASEQSLGGSVTHAGNVGVEGELNVFGAKTELTRLANLSLVQTMKKTDVRTTGVELNVDLSGVESTGITDHDDRPLAPGEKVDRYRFMSFYLEPSTKNFQEFFRRVVDPEWLQSNDEEARVLRQAVGKANKTWRVLHRVTYVERPALKGLGLDLRKLAEGDAATREILTHFDQLENRHRELLTRLEGLEKQLGLILAAIGK